MEIKIPKERRYIFRADVQIEAFFNAHPHLNISDFLRVAVRKEIESFNKLDNEQEYERLVNEYGTLTKAREELKKYVH